MQFLRGLRPNSLYSDVIKVHLRLLQGLNLRSKNKACVTASARVGTLSQNGYGTLQQASAHMLALERGLRNHDLVRITQSGLLRKLESLMLFSCILHWIPFGDHPLKLERYRED